MVTQTATFTSSPTYYEKLGRETTWGRYLTGLQRCSITLAADLFERPGTVLEIGADGGRWSSLLAKQGWEAVCTDVRPMALEVCQSRLPRAKCILVNAADTKIPCATDAANLILCMEVDPVTSSGWFVEEASRVLAPGGILVATLNNKSSLRAVFHKLFRPGDAVTRKQCGFYEVSYHERRNRLRRSGFRIIHEEGCCWPPFARDSNSSLVPSCVRLEKYLGLRRLPLLSPWVVFVAQKRHA
jgi:SAM-dependent methyltransferase